MVFSAGIVGLGIAGLVFSAPIGGNYNKVKCSTLLFVNEVLQGADQTYSPNNSWQGVGPVVSQASASINSIEAKQSQFLDMANQPMGSNAFSSSQSVLDTIGTTYDESNTGNWGVTSPVDGSSNYIVDMRRNWKSYSVSSSAAHPIYFQRYMYQNVVFDQMKKLKDAANAVVQGDVFASARSALNEVNNAMSQINNLKKDVVDYIDKGDSPVDGINIGLSIYYAVIIACAGAMVVGILLTMLCGRCGFLSHIGWFVLAILMIIGFIVSAVLFPFSVVFIEACDMIKLDNLADNHELIPQESWDQVSICLVGNGDLYTNYALDTKIGFAMDAMKAFDLVNQLYNNDKNQLVYNVTDAYVKELANIRDKKPGDASKALFTSQDLLKDASNNCQGDLVVWHTDDCAGREALTTSGSSKSGLCVPIKSFTTSTIDSAIGSRYDSCSTYRDKVKNLVKYADDLAPMLNSIINDVNNNFINAMEQDNNEAKIKPLMKSAYDLKVSVEEDINKLSKMLQNGLNCSFLRNSFDRIYLATCKYLSPALASLSIIIVLISLFSIFAIITAIYLHRMYYVINNKEFIQPTQK